jgi:hypothetical protein
VFDHTLYVPVLRGKKGEYWALAKLADEDSRRITPLLEIVNKTFAQPEATSKKDKPAKSKPLVKVKKEKLTPDEVIREKIVGELAENWGEQPIFVDFGQVDHSSFRAQGGEHLVSAFARDAGLNKLVTIPVTSLDRDRNYQLATKQVCETYNLGVCIRLTPNDFSSRACTPNLMRLVSALRLTPAEVDLIIDHAYIGTSVPSIADFCNMLPNLAEWRTFIWTAGAFPENLSQWREPGQYVHARSDWLTWRDQVLSGQLPRIPIYSDFTTQHGFYKEPVGKPRPSASLRYTSEKHWVVMRGQATNAKNSTGWDQYPYQAMMLCKRDEFLGRGSCQGDEYVEDMSKYALATGRPKKRGNPGTWLRATVNHHMTFVVRQIASLYESGAADR